MWLWVKNFFWAFLVLVLINIALRPSSTVLGVAFFVLWIGGTKIDQARRKRKELEGQALEREQERFRIQQMTPEEREELVRRKIEQQPWGREYLERKAQEAAAQAAAQATAQEATTTTQEATTTTQEATTTTSEATTPKVQVQPAEG